MVDGVDVDGPRVLLESVRARLSSSCSSDDLAAVVMYT